MQPSDPEQLVNCLSAQQLLYALNMLQKINDKDEQLELSFNQSSTSLFNTTAHHKQQHMDFEIYMAMKKNQKQSNSKKTFCKKKVDMNKQCKSKNQKKIQPSKHHLNRTPTNVRAVTPTKKTQKVKTSVCGYKSRSHSPIVPITPTKLTQRKQNKKTGKENIPVQSMQKSIKERPTITEKSKKIMELKQKKGQIYIPIQHRQTKVLRERQQKVAKMQRLTLMQRDLEERQCTFKPAINSYKPKKAEKIQTSITQHTAGIGDSVITESLLGIFDQSYTQPDESMINYSIVEKSKSTGTTTLNSGSLKQNSQKSNKTKLNNNRSDNEQEKIISKSKEPKKKYKNPKFNILLDFIS